MDATLFLFDLDGTLVSTGGAGLRALETTFRERYKIATLYPALNPAGKTDPAIFREILDRFLARAPRPGELDEIAETYLSHLKNEMIITSTFQVCPGVEDFVGSLSVRADVLLGLGTGNLERGARLKLSPTNLNAYFQFGGFGSDAEDRAALLRIGFERAEERRNGKIPTDRVFVVGDTLLDIQAARGAGFKAVAVATGGVSYETLETGKPDILFHDLTEGFDFLNQL